MTPRLPFARYAVFSDHAFGGAAVAVFDVPDSLADELRRAIPREFNLAAAVFVEEPRNPVNSARLRVFGPEGEKAFCAAGIVGAAAHLAQKRAGALLARQHVLVALELSGGSLRCEARRSAGGVFASFAGPFTATPHPVDMPDAAALAAALGLAPVDIGFGGHGVAFSEAFGLFAPLCSCAALERAAPTPALDALLGASPGAWLYAQETDDAACAIRARMLLKGGREAAVSPEAALAFAGVAAQFEQPEDGAHAFLIAQGDTIGRPSRVGLRMEMAKGRPVSAGLEGQVTPVGEGYLTL